MTGQKRKEKKMVELQIVLEYEKVSNSDDDYLQQWSWQFSRGTDDFSKISC